MFDWQKWIAGYTACNVNFSLCNFIELLFNRYYDCLPECVDCLPCKDPEPVKQGCWDEKDRILRPLGFIDQINEIFCFEDYCRKREEQPNEQPNDQVTEPPREELREPKRQTRKKPESPIDHIANTAKKKAARKRKKDN
jgi:hypothetical protein